MGENLPMLSAHKGLKSYKLPNSLTINSQIEENRNLFTTLSHMPQHIHSKTNHPPINIFTFSLLYTQQTLKNLQYSLCLKKKTNY